MDNSTTYKTMTEDTTNAVQNKLKTIANNLHSNLHSKGSISKNVKVYMKATGGCHGELHDNPKLHKTGVPLRTSVNDRITQAKNGRDRWECVACAPDVNSVLYSRHPKLEQTSKDTAIQRHWFTLNIKRCWKSKHLIHVQGSGYIQRNIPINLGNSHPFHYDLWNSSLCA